MLVFRLTDENVRRTEGKRKTPLVPLGVRVADDVRVNRNLAEWIVRYETFKRACENREMCVQRQEDDEADFKSEIDRVIQEAMLVTDASLVQKKRMALIVCKRCKSEDLVKDERQTKSADEGATGFYLCNACGHQWKQEG